MGLGSDAFQNVLDAMFDMPDADALKLLQVYSAQAKSPEIIEKIIENVNSRAMPDTPIESLSDIPKTIEAFLKNAAKEAAKETK
jgi:UDP-N-acetylmuramate-alanine ligase